MVDAEEQRLIESILRGDREAYSQLIRPNLPMWLKLASAVLENSFDADDAVQNAMIRCYEHLGSFRFEAKFSTWASKIVLRECHAIRKHRTPNIAPWPEMFRGTVAPSETTEDFILLQQVVYESLDHDEQQLFTQILEEGRSIKEVAERVGTSPGSIKTRMWRIRERLKKVLRAGGDR